MGAAKTRVPHRGQTLEAAKTTNAVASNNVWKHRKVRLLIDGHWCNAGKRAGLNRQAALLWYNGVRDRDVDSCK